MKVEAVDSYVVQSPRRVAEHQAHREAPVRTCVGCKRRALIGELLRVVAVDGRLVVDERRRLPGRGAWVHPGPGCLTKAERRRAFPRALKVPGTLDTRGLHDHVERLVRAAPTEQNGNGTLPDPKERRKQVDPS